MSVRLAVLFSSLLLANVHAASAGFVRVDVPAAIEGKRVALVIGNGDYQNSNRPVNSRHDARAVADALKKYGFQTTLHLDLSRQAFPTALSDFERHAEGAELAIVFYSGSGVAVDDMHYLLPVDHPVLQMDKSSLESFIPASDLIGALDSVPGPKLVILDNCRTDPFRRKEATQKPRSARSSQTRIIPAGSDSDLMIAYSTRYGDVAIDGPPGGNSPYTENLIKILNEPGLEARIVLDRVRDAVYNATHGRQDPSTEGTLGSKLVFINPKLSEQPTKSLGTPASKIDEAQKAFALIKDTTSPAMLESFAGLFPDTIYAEFARVRAEEIRKAAVTPPSEPAPRRPKRHALVVGIKTYDNLPRQRQLTKAVNDARSVAATLKDVGFEITRSAEDIDRRAFYQRWQEFVQAIQPGDEVVFYFSGHGLELAGLNYLVPRDVPAFNEGQDQLLKNELIGFSDLQQQLAERKPRMALFILDACRDNPFDPTGTKSLGGRKGLRPVPEVRGMFVMFAAGYHQAALDRLNDQDPDPHSVYTRKLLPLMRQPGLRLQDLAVEVRDQVDDLARTVNHTQLPAYYDQLRGKFCLAGCN